MESARGRLHSELARRARSVVGHTTAKYCEPAAAKLARVLLRVLRLGELAQRVAARNLGTVLLVSAPTS